MDQASRAEAEFDQLAAKQLGEERYPIFARWRTEPVFFSRTADAWILTRFDDVRAVLMGDETFRPLVSGPGAPVYGRTFLQMSGAEHSKKVGIVGRRIRSAQAIASGLGDVVQAVSQQRAAAQPLEEAVDLKEHYTAMIPLDVLTELFQLEHTPELRRIYDTIEHGGLASVADPSAHDKGLAAIPMLKQHLAPIIAERRVNPGDDLISDLVTAQYEGAVLPDDELVAIFAFLVIAGVKTTDRVLSCMVRHLLTDPALWRRLQDGADDDNLLLSYAAEALRLHPPASGVSRQARADVTVGGVDVRAGDRVLLLMGAANRDPEHFTDPEEFVLDRFIAKPERQFTNAAHTLPFGAGEHFCVGVRLAATELVESLRALLNRADAIESVGPVSPLTGFLHFAPSALPTILRK
ncbi:MAG: hypothetical protein QOH52_4631 [Pseudonocardiales bacterium]|nr:hypothetical protein [Pseudonocardiales bacterium]